MQLTGWVARQLERQTDRPTYKDKNHNLNTVPTDTQQVGIVMTANVKIFECT